MSGMGIRQRTRMEGGCQLAAVLPADPKARAWPIGHACSARSPGPGSPAVLPAAAPRNRKLVRGGKILLYFCGYCKVKPSWLSSLTLCSGETRRLGREHGSPSAAGQSSAGSRRCPSPSPKVTQQLPFARPQGGDGARRAGGDAAPRQPRAEPRTAAGSLSECVSRASRYFTPKFSISGLRTRLRALSGLETLAGLGVQPEEHR